jgi:hypothetical protein
VWNDLIKVKDLYLSGRYIKIGNGCDTDFWNDPWCGSAALKDKFSELYEVCNEQKESVAGIARRGWRLTFRRWLDENAQNKLRMMRDVLTSCALGQGKDKPIWMWENHKKFSVKTMYSHLCSVGEFRKTRHPRNVKFDKVLETCFSGIGNSRFSEAWNL